MGAGDREILERMGQIERQIKALYRHLDLEIPEEASADDVSPEVLELIKAGKDAEAAKLHRQESGTSLADANAVIQQLK